MTQPIEPSGAQQRGWQTLRWLRIIVLAGVFAGFGQMIANGIVAVVVQARGGADWDPVLTPSWVIASFTLAPLVALLRTWNRAAQVPGLAWFIGAGAVVLAALATLTRGWWALPLAGMTVLLLIGRGVVRAAQDRRTARAEHSRAAARAQDRAARAAARGVGPSTLPVSEGPDGPRRRSRRRR